MRSFGMQTSVHSVMTHKSVHATAAWRQEANTSTLSHTAAPSTKPATC